VSRTTEPAEARQPVAPDDRGGTLDGYQAAALRTVNAALDERERLMDAAAGLAEEGGEVLGLVRKHVYMGHALDRERLSSELGDALWCLATLASAAGIPLSAIAAANAEKLHERYPDGYSHDRSRERGKGDDRP
jgi:NTP pyrophosphatase (non-canonical NTP hydrolase)